MAKKRYSRGFMRRVISGYLYSKGDNDIYPSMETNAFNNRILSFCGTQLSRSKKSIIESFFAQLLSTEHIDNIYAYGKRKLAKVKRIKIKTPINYLASKDFLQSPEWRRLRYDALKLADGKCQLCGRSKKDGIILNVDHIKPRKTHPELALDINNLQVMCNECNHGKGNRDDTDWRLSGNY